MNIFDLERLIPIAAAFIVAIAVHEASHALVATALGDPGPRKAGRLTLNPIRHLDPLGTITLFVVGFGWGRPVMVSPWMFKIGQVTGMALVAFAGPLSNILTAIAVAIPLRAGIIPDGMPVVVALTVIQISILLAVFNLIPLPPLDGFSVLIRFLPKPLAAQVGRLAQYGPGVLLGLFAVSYLLDIPIIGAIVRPPMEFLFRLIVGI